MLEKNSLYKPELQLSIAGLWKRASFAPDPLTRDRPAMLHLPAAAVMYYEYFVI
jgi:hypothetical protein